MREGATSDDRPLGTIVFDLDGTVVDSAPDLADALDALLAEQDLAPLGLAVGRQLIGHGIGNLVLGGLQRSGISPDPARLSASVDRFREIYSGALSRKTRPYAGVEAGLERLRGAGWRCGVCTNKLERYARQILSDLGLIRFFDVVAGPDTFAIGKPHPEHLVRTVDALGGRVARSLMVGDSEVDIATAKAAGIPIVAVTYGYAKTALASLGPDLVVDDFDAVVPAIARLSAGWKA